MQITTFTYEYNRRGLFAYPQNLISRQFFIIFVQVKLYKYRTVNEEAHYLY